LISTPKCIESNSELILVLAFDLGSHPEPRLNYFLFLGVKCLLLGQKLTSLKFCHNFAYLLTQSGLGLFKIGNVLDQLGLDMLIEQELREYIELLGQVLIGEVDRCVHHAQAVCPYRAGCSGCSSSV